MSYYSNVNPDLLRQIPVAQERVLEIGCGSGALARAYRARNPSCAYFGVELFETVARESEAVVDHVICGDIETDEVMAQLDAARDGKLFDTLVFGDVLEHLRDPWALLSALRERMKPEAVCIACIPNIGHWSIVESLIKGRWDYQDQGLLDRTHLRFFTLGTMKELFRLSGWTFHDAEPRNLWPEKTKAAIDRLAPVGHALGATDEQMTRDLSAFQWVIRATNGPVAPPVTIVGLGMKPFAGVTDARIAHPWAAMKSLLQARATWAANTVVVPKGWPPGALTLHRQFVNGEAFQQTMEKLAQNWAIISDIDDDPHHWEQFVQSDFYAYRAAHAVTVSTPALAELVRQWNPNVKVFPNAIHELPPVPTQTPKSGRKLRIFFGALNREQDLAEILAGVVRTAEVRKDDIEFVIVHDQTFADALPAAIARETHGTLPHAQYMQVLASCDVALLPLRDTPFNRLKSDLKFIECCAAGAVPICSSIVYGEQDIHREIGVFVDDVSAWGEALGGLCDDLSALAERRRKGLDYVSSQRMQAQQAGARAAYYAALVAQRPALETQRRERMSAWQKGRRSEITETQ